MTGKRIGFVNQRVPAMAGAVDQRARQQNELPSSAAGHNLQHPLSLLFVRCQAIGIGRNGKVDIFRRWIRHARRAAKIVNIEYADVPERALKFGDKLFSRTGNQHNVCHTICVSGELPVTRADRPPCQRIPGQAGDVFQCPR